MSMYVVINSEYDYDSPSSERLLSCAVFSTHAEAKKYVDERGEEVYDDDGILASKSIIIEADVDEFVNNSHANEKLNALLDTLPSCEMKNPQNVYVALAKDGSIFVYDFYHKGCVKVKQEMITTHTTHYDANLCVVNNKIVHANVTFEHEQQIYISTASLKGKTLDEAIKDVMSALLERELHQLDAIMKKIQQMRDVAGELDEKGHEHD